MQHLQQVQAAQQLQHVSSLSAATAAAMAVAQANNNVNGDPAQQVAQQAAKAAAEAAHQHNKPRPAPIQMGNPNIAAILAAKQVSTSAPISPISLGALCLDGCATRQIAACHWQCAHGRPLRRYQGSACRTQHSRFPSSPSCGSLHAVGWADSAQWSESGLRAGGGGVHVTLRVYVCYVTCVSVQGQSGMFSPSSSGPQMFSPNAMSMGNTNQLSMILQQNQNGMQTPTTPNAMNGFTPALLQAQVCVHARGLYVALCHALTPSFADSVSF